MSTLGYINEIPIQAHLLFYQFLAQALLRQTVGLAVDSQGRPQKYMLDGHDDAYWTEQTFTWC